MLKGVIYAVATLEIGTRRSVPRDAEPVNVEDYVSGFHVVFFCWRVVVWE